MGTLYLPKGKKNTLFPEKKKKLARQLVCDYYILIISIFKALCSQDLNKEYSNDLVHVLHLEMRERWPLVWTWFSVMFGFNLCLLESNWAVHPVTCWRPNGRILKKFQKESISFTHLPQGSNERFTNQVDLTQSNMFSFNGKTDLIEKNPYVCLSGLSWLPPLVGNENWYHHSTGFTWVHSCMSV